MKKEKPLLRVGGSDSYMDIPTHSGTDGGSDGRTDGRTDGQTRHLIEMHGRI